MNAFSKSMSIIALGSLSVFVPAAPVQAATDPAATATTTATVAQDTAPSKKFELAVNRTEDLQLPLNKAMMYREAAVALAPTDAPQAVSLLKRALADIDAYEASLKAQKMLDEHTFQQLEFGRLPVIMLMERIDPAEALNVLAPPQTADRDTAFQALFFERLAAKNVDLVREAALRKMDYGVTPAVVSAYSVLQKRSPDAARTLAIAIVTKLSKADPASDPGAVQSAFALLRLLRTDIGALAPAMIIDPNLLGPDSVHDLFAFIGDAFLASKDPESLILGQRPGLYVAALDEYAPDKAQDVKQLPFAAPDAKSEIFAPEQPVYDTNHPDPATLKPEQIAQRAAMKARVEAQIKDSIAQITLLVAKVNQPSLTQKERDDTVFAVVDEANKAIALARTDPTVLDREAFNKGELEFYNMGIVTNVVDSVSSLLQTYASNHPKVAEQAAESLDGPEVQAQVGLQVAIKEMTGKAAYLVPPAKPPANSPPPGPAAQAATR